MTVGTRLDSWKEIAQYLGRDVRTVIRWEERGLPVHRVPGGKQSRVFAISSELDEWLAHGPVNDKAALSLDPRLTRAAVGLLAFAALGAAWMVTRPDATPRRLEVAGGQLLAYDAGSSDPLWTRRFDEGDLSTSWGRWYAIRDLDGDGREEMITAVEVHRRESNEHAGMLSRLTPEGRTEWSLIATDRVRFRAQEYGPPWPTDNFAVYHAGPEIRIAWVVHQFTWWPGLLISVNAQGERKGLFVNSGWIRDVQQSRNGRHLLVTGITKSHGAYFLAVLDPLHPDGRSPELFGAETECVSCPSGAPLHYFVFPRTDVSRVRPFPAYGPSIQTFEDHSAQVETHESEGGVTGTVIFTFSPDAELRSARFSDAFWEQHRLLEADGALTHTEANCPERRGLDVQHWTPAGGWQRVRVVTR